MCSIQDGDVPLEKPKVEKSVGRKCLKCKKEPAVLITRVNDAFCRSCFQVYVTHKFRAAIGKTKLVRDGETILVAFSGGSASAALLHLIQEGLSQRAHKKLRFTPGVLFIDEGGSTCQTVEERKSSCDHVKTILQKSGFPFHIAALEEGLNMSTFKGRLPESMTLGHSFTSVNKSDSIPNETNHGQNKGTLLESQPSKCDKEDLESHVISKDNQPLRVDSGLGSQLRQLLDSVKSVSGKEDLIQTLRHQMLYEAARHCGYSKVMLGSCGTRLAVRLLTDISTGRGMHAAMECAFADKRHKYMLFLRPLRDFSTKEIAMYNSLHNVETVFTPKLTTKGNVGASIEHLTESFVTGLQAEYLSTVSNIMRTGEKLDSTPESSSENSCALCQGILDTDVGVSSALSALEFSRQISTGKNAIVKKGGNSCGKSDIKGDNSSSTVECCGEGDGSCQSSVSKRPSCDQVTSRLCYGCRIVANEMEDINTFPDFVFDTVSRQARRSDMKAEIEDFLLTDS
ncbi:cytoplasmic tRNA 2-thiolation protein 2-A-like [Mya arenaria]|uniref:cytoplasmic tRNA 2-thiolation protein 2-A-like n=1 Tax=Mya arenaria TaxID=6604 RepID=UPI0022E45776|nr:cytoplasmic tRNA 2-thiolation protein 2-A-like [Mya arenaria]